MAKQLNVNLAFTADNSRAKAQIQELQKVLDSLISSPRSGGELGITKELIQAQSAAADLKVALNQAVTPSGSLDLSKFNDSLQKSGRSLEDYRRTLEKLGPAGSEAFLKLSNSIVSAEAPLKRVSSQLENFKTTLANTARWQISSSILHGFMGTLSSAYGYAKDLNRSLNDIRIVTGQSEEQMAKFAEQANKAAQSLSSTTTAYTNAALIFYQQGLDDEAVQGRTDTVIKMSNVTRDSAEEVSSYMTAIWENFYDGSKSLEYYADVITRLGADTAASSAEIAEGLESFASIGNTIGLSYEYATSALTTIVAKTRASASEVGNGLRTIFSRLQNLSLGETLDDGTDLTKYSKALATVGVNIKDASGELKSMDDILDDLAGKWNTLDQAEKVALANTVGGVRQYTKLISLMDNWDFMKQNIASASNSSGSLQEQADIYAESWEAARDRVKAAAQSVYADLLDDKFFIGITDLFAKIISGIDNLIDRMGGLKVLLPSILVLMTKLYGQSMATSIDNLVFNIQKETKSYQEQQQALRDRAYDEAMKINANTGTELGDQKTNSLKIQLELSKALQQSAKDLDEQSIQELQNRMDIVNQYRQQVEEAAKLKDQAVDNLQDSRQSLIRQSARSGKAESDQVLNSDGSNMTSKQALRNLQNMETAATKAQKEFKDLNKQFISGNISAQKYQDGIKSISANLKKADVIVDENSNSYKTLKKAMDASKQGTDAFKKTIEQLSQEGGLASDTLLDIDNAAEKYEKAFGWSRETTDNFRQSVQALVNSGYNLTDAEKAAAAAIEDFRTKLESAKSAVAQLGTTGQTIMAVFQGISQTMMGLTSGINLIETLANPDISGLEKFKTLLISLPMTIMGVASGIKQLQEIYQNVNAVLAAYNSLSVTEQALAQKNLFTKAALTVQEGLFNLALKLENASKGEGVVANLALAASNIALEASCAPILIIVLAITAALAVLIVIIWAISSAIKAAEANSPAGKLKAAEEKAEALADSLETAKTKAQELQSAFDEYNSIYEQLQNCTKGTQEWSDALAEANTKTTELLQQFPELLKVEGLFDENGLLNPEVLSDALNDANSVVDALNAATVKAQAEVLQKQVDVNLKSARNEYMDQFTQTVTDDDHNTSYTYTDYYGFDKALDSLLEKFKASGSSALTLEDALSVLPDSIDKTSEAGTKLAESLLEVANQSIKASTAMDNADLSVINSWASSQGVDLETGQAQLMKDAYNDVYNDISNAIKKASDQNNKANNKDESKISGVSETFNGKSVTEAFNIARGENYQLASNGVRGTDDNRTYVYLENGEEKEYTIAEMQATIAAAAALEKLTGIADNAAESLNTLDKNAGKDIGAGIKNWIASGNFESMTEDQFKEMTEGMKDDNGDYDQDKVEDYFKENLGLGADEDVASVLGEDWYTKFTSGALNFETALTGLTGQMSKSAADIYKNIQGLDDMTIGNQKELADAVQSAFEANGSEGATALVKQINAALADGASQDDISVLNDVISGMNWDTASIADFKDALVNAGIDAEKLGIDVNAIFDAMSTGAANELSSIQETYKSIQDIIKDLTTGDTISDEDYNTLAEQIGTEAMDGFFSTMADGTHQLVGDAEDFYNVITENSRQMMLNNISNSSSLKNALNNDNVNIDNINAQATMEDSAELTSARLMYLDSLGLEGDELTQLAELQDKYRNGIDFTAEDLESFNSLMTNHNITEEEFNNLITQNNETIRQNSEALLSTATSLEELDGLVAQVAEASGGVVYGYSEALINLASQYDNCTNEIEDYQKALSSGNAETITAAEESLRAATTIGELAEKYDLVAEDVETQARLLQATRKELNLTKEQAARLAVANQRMNRGVETLNENFSDWKKILKSTDHTTQDYAETLNDAYDALADLTGAIDAASIPLDFLDNTTEAGSKHLEWLEKAAQGDVQSINLLGSALAVASVQAMEMDDSFTKAFADMAGVGIDQAQNKFAELQGTVSTAMQQIHNAIQAGLSADEIQAKINSMGTGWIDALNQMAVATGMSVDEMNSLLNQLGVQAKVDVKDVEQKMSVATYTEVVEPNEVTVFDSDGNKETRHGWTHYTVPGPSKEVMGTVQVAQISTEGGDIGAPVVTYTGTSGASRGGGVSPSSTSSGSGGSSKSTEHNDEDYKDYTDEKERYHVIKNQLEDLTSQYDRISKAKDKAFGTARLANLNKEIAAQKKLTQANKQYLDEIESYLAQDKGTMASYGAIFDNNGTILNYDELVKSQVDAYNSAVDTYNAAYTDDEGAKAAFEAAQERYDDFQDALDQYEETQDLFNEQTQTYIDSLNAERELLLERTQLQVELKVNVEEDALNFLEYALDNIENKAYDCAEAFGYLNDMTAAYLGTAKAYEEGLRSLFANQGLSDADFDNFINGNSATFNTLSDMLSNGESAGFQSEDVETIREYIQELISANENLQEVRQTVHDQILTVWDEWNEKLDDGISKLEHLQAIQESYVNIIDIVGQKNLGVSNAFMRKLAQQGIDQANDKLIAEKARYDALKQARDDAYATFEEQKNKGILSEEEIKIWEDSLQQMDEDVQSASEDFQSAWEDALTSIGEAFEAEVDRIIEAYDDAAAGLMSSVSQLQEAFDRKSDLADQYLDDYEKIYQFSKLNRDIENSIDSTDNVKAKKELLELQSKINAYEEAGTDISEYELQQLQKEYELKKAQIELEESQEAKSQVKMQRDSEGNYSYVYTANDEDVSKAEQNYEDKLHDLQQLNAEYINDLQSNMIQMEQDYQDKVQEIMTDTSLTAEERMVQLNDLNEYYDEKMKFYISEAQLWAQNSQTLYEQDWTNYAAATGYKISAEDEWLDHWNETQLALLTGFDNLEDYQTNHNMNVANLLLASGEAFSTWQANIEEAMNNAGTSMGTFEEDATENLNSVAEESETTKDQIVTDSEDMVNAVEDVMDAVARWEDDYSQTVQNMINKNKLLVQSFNSLIAAWSEYKVSAAANDSDSSSSSSGSGSGNGSGSGSSSGSGSGSGSGSSSDNSDKVEGVAAAIWMDGSSTSGWGTGATRRQRFQEKGVSDAQAYINAHASNGDIYSAWASRRDQLKKYYYGSFDTGGYTGEWGVDGKLALLHEKELVLNADDTANFLQAIDVVRQISDMIDLNALSSAGGLSSLFAATTSGSDQNLQQEVHITAEFPNATDKNQITEAFNDIINLASQYANRK